VSLRLLEIYHQKGKADEIDFLLKDLPIIETWHYHVPENNESVTKVLLKSESTDSILDVLHKFSPDERHIRIVILPVEATIPRPEEPGEEQKEEQPKEKSPQRISIEELYQKMTGVSGLSRKFIIMAAVATFVAGLGLLKNDVAIIIGSMVIAPLLYPNMALSFATTLADIQLAQRAIKTNIIGFFMVLTISIMMGLFLDVDPSTPQIVARSNVSHFYIFLALASGIAGAYSITAGVAEALVGVMVAVAILPPLVAAGLLLGGMYWLEATGALLLCFVNIVSVNLAGVVTFLIEGIQPKKWWEAEKARKAVWVAIPVWIILLLILVILIFIEQNLRSM
jgi:uncharacterized hydrophobic protein (TIGR00341 family)